MPKSLPKSMSMADRYATTYFLLMNAEDADMQARIKSVKDDPNRNDARVNEFIKKVVKAAEATEEIVAEKNAAASK